MKNRIKHLLHESLKSVSIGNLVLHTSNPIHRNKILKEGLLPKQESWGCAIGSDMNAELGDTKAIFVVDSKIPYESCYDDDVWVIDTRMINNKWYTDEYVTDALYTLEPIPLKAIKLIYKGSGNDEGNFDDTIYKSIFY